MYTNNWRDISDIMGAQPMSGESGAVDSRTDEKSTVDEGNESSHIDSPTDKSFFFNLHPPHPHPEVSRRKLSR